MSGRQAAWAAALSPAAVLAWIAVSACTETFTVLRPHTAAGAGLGGAGGACSRPDLPNK